MKKKLLAIMLAITLIVGAFAFAACDRNGNGGGSNGNGGNGNGGTIHPTVSGNLMEGIAVRNVEATQLSPQFINAAASFSIDLFRQAILEDESTLISPISVLIALAMTANGARGNTLSQMEEVLGGGMSIAQLNRYLHSFISGLYSGDKSMLNIANSIWFRNDRLFVEPDFLQANADYFGANAYAALFDESTVEDINAWVYDHTDGMIEEILEKICDDAVMFLINALMFDAEWETIFREDQIRNHNFNAFDGIEQNVPFMWMNDEMPQRQFIEDDNATGFIKPYHGGYYSFVALLPNEGVCLMDYVAAMTGTDFVNTIQNAQKTSVLAGLPKFEFEYAESLNEQLKALGMTSMFGGGLEGIGHSPRGNLFVSNVQHNTFISVNERGTRAGAVTSVEVSDESAPQFERIVILDRPFVFAIIDNATDLPIFMGTLLNV